MHTAAPWALVATGGMALAFAAGLGLGPVHDEGAPAHPVLQLTCAPPARAFDG